MSSSHLQDQNSRYWRFTWESLAHIPTLRLFLFSPGFNPSIQCKNLKSSPNFERSLLSVAWNQEEILDGSGDPVDFLLRVPIPKALIDPTSPVDARALEDHIEVKLLLLLPVDHPLAVADFGSASELDKGGFGREMGVLDSSMSLSLNSDLKRLSSEGGVHFYCRSCSRKLSKNPRRYFVEMPSVNWREAADNWFGACCCSFGGISEKLVSEYVNSYFCAEGTCLLDETSIIICKDDLEGYSFVECLDENIKHESNLDLISDNYSTSVVDSRTHATGDMSYTSEREGVDVLCGTLDSLSLKEEGLKDSSFCKSLLRQDCTGKLTQKTGHCFAGNTDVAPFDSIDETCCANNMDLLEYDLKLSSVNLDKMDSVAAHGRGMKYQSHCCGETNDLSIHSYERSLNGVSVPSKKNQQSINYAKLQKNQKRHVSAAVGSGFVVRSTNLSNDIEWVEFLCNKCSSLLGACPSTKDGNILADAGIRLFKCCISTSVPVGGLADVFRSHTLQRVFTNQLLESAVDELSFRTVVKDLRAKSPMLQIVLLNSKAWCCTGYCLDDKNEIEPIPQMNLQPVVKVLFSDCSIATKSETREIEEWAAKNNADEIYMMQCHIKELIQSLKLAKESFPPSCTFMQGLSLSYMER